jgi:hypothetical protein
MAARVRQGAQMAERRSKGRPKERRSSQRPTPEFGPDSFSWRVGELIIGRRRHAADGEAGSA